MEKMQILFQLL